jgi:hypothetical protein
VPTNGDKPPVSTGSDSIPATPRDPHPLRTALEIRLCIVASDLVLLAAHVLSRVAHACSLTGHAATRWLTDRALGLLDLADKLLDDPPLAGVTLLCVALVIDCLALSVMRFV